MAKTTTVTVKCEPETGVRFRDIKRTMEDRNGPNNVDHEFVLKCLMDVWEATDGQH